VRQIHIGEHRLNPLLLLYISAGSPNFVAIYTKQGEPRGFLIRIVATYRTVHLRNGHVVTKGTYSIQPESNFKGIQWRIRAHRHADEKTNHLRRHYAIGSLRLIWRSASQAALSDTKNRKFFLRDQVQCFSIT